MSQRGVSPPHSRGWETPCSLNKHLDCVVTVIHTVKTVVMSEWWQDSVCGIYEKDSLDFKFLLKLLETFFPHYI